MLLKRPSPQHSADDSVLQADSITNIDYLAYEWEDEHLWSCWKSVRCPRGRFPFHSRLENAIWRAWSRRISNLGTISPRTINWSRENDVSSLYGPSWLNAKDSQGQQVRPAAPVFHPKAASRSILKDRSRSDMLFQATRSSFALSCRTITTLQNPLDGHWKPKRVLLDAPSITNPKGHFSENDSGKEASHSHTNIPSFDESYSRRGRKNIRFCDEVEQRISTRGQEDDNQGPNIDTDKDSRITYESMLMKLFGVFRPGIMKNEHSKLRPPTRHKMTASSPPTTLKL